MGWRQGVGKVKGAGGVDLPGESRATGASILSAADMQRNRRFGLLSLRSTTTLGTETSAAPRFGIWLRVPVDTLALWLSVRRLGRSRTGTIILAGRKGQGGHTLRA